MDLKFRLLDNYRKRHERFSKFLETVKQMAQTRILRDGTKAVASTIYLPSPVDTKAMAVAKARTHAEKKKVSKSRVLVDTIEKNL